jgi:OFA family oxalate/formate antiporter-like MFS transporter
MPNTPPPVSRAYPWLILASFSLMFFVVTAATFTSLGVVLPAMVNELQWSWTDAGLGFTLLGLACGLSSYLPALAIRILGVRGAIACGAAILAGGFACLFKAHGIPAYFAGTTLIGIGYSFVATVPGTYMLARCFRRQSMAFGIYFSVGGLGGFVGPGVYFFAIDVWNTWRMHWMLAAIAIVVSGVLAILVVREDSAEQANAAAVAAAAKGDERAGVYYTAQTWTARQALRTPQFYVIAAAYTSFLLVGITCNSFAVAHIAENGFSPAVAASMLSLQALINAIARVCGGLVGEVMEPRRLLMISLVTLIAGLVAISFANSWTMLLLFAAGIGIGYGLTFVTTSVLLSNYFGRGPYLPLFSIINLISTTACFGPVLGGAMKDKLGNFSTVFLVYTLLPLLVLAAAAFMRPPRRAPVQAMEAAEALMGQAR